MNIQLTQQNNAGASALLAGRILLAALFLASGFGKLAQPDGTIAYIASMGLPAPSLAFIGALVMELGGGLLLVTGFQTRAVAGALAVFSIVSAALFHTALGDQNQLFHFLKNVALAGGLLQVVVIGAGRFSVDERRKSGHVQRAGVPAAAR